jgi:hypothetical protein
MGLIHDMRWFRKEKGRKNEQTSISDRGGEGIWKEKCNYSS